MAFSKPLVTRRPGSSFANDITSGAGAAVVSMVVATVVAMIADWGKEEKRLPFGAVCFYTAASLLPQPLT